MWFGKQKRWQKRLEQILCDEFNRMAYTLELVLARERILMADATQFEKDLAGVKDAVNKAADRVVKAIAAKGPLTQEQTDAADQALNDIHAALDGIAPDAPVVVPPAPPAPPADGGTPAAS